MRIAISLAFFSLIYSLALGQSIDTLRNLPIESLLISTKYNSTAKWGYYTGHNYLGRQQFAEKYYVQGAVTVIGIVSQLTGKVSASSLDSSAFTLWSVGSNRLPNSQLNAIYSLNKDLDVSGSPMVKLFRNPSIVSDSFYVAFDLLDYSHHSFKDTIGLLYGTHGSRGVSDLVKFGRNALQVHSHGPPVWRDFYSQNFTPIATHFALFPIVSNTPKTGLSILETNEFEILELFPNPFAESFTIKLKDRNMQMLTMLIYNDLGNIVYSRQIDKNSLSTNVLHIDCQHLPSGKYIVLIKGETSGMATQMVKI